MKNFFDYHYSREKNDYVFNIGILGCPNETRCTSTCREVHKKVNLEPYYDLKNKKKLENSVACFGCSFTYGSGLSEENTWPSILESKMNIPILNFGVSGLGIDSIYNNLVKSLEYFQFRKVIFLFPSFERRLLRFKFNEDFFKIPITLQKKSDSYITRGYKFIKPNFILPKIEKIKRKIVNDRNNRYSKTIINKIFKLCKDKNIKSFCSSWNSEVYEYIKKNAGNVLPPFPRLDMFKERASDGEHPSGKHYEYWVNQIYKKVSH